MIISENGGQARKVCHGRVFRQSDVPKYSGNKRFIFKPIPTKPDKVVACRKGKVIRM